MSKEVIEALRKQAGEIAKEGHFGWGNTMTAAADALDTLLAERDALKKDAERLSWLIDNGVCASSVGGDPIRLTREAIDAALQGEQL